MWSRKGLVRNATVSAATRETEVAQVGAQTEAGPGAEEVAQAVEKKAESAAAVRGAKAELEMEPEGETGVDDTLDPEEVWRTLSDARAIVGMHPGD